MKKAKAFFLGRVLTVTGIVLLLCSLSLLIFNKINDVIVGDKSKHALDLVQQKVGAGSGTDGAFTDGDGDTVPVYLLDPNIEMPVVVVEGREYIGVLSFPSLKLELPVLSEWSYDGLNIAPCRYSGSVYLNNMVLAAHNYVSQFGRISSLDTGDEVVFTDIDGNVFTYKVASAEVLSPYSVKEMKNSEWDLTLFTCTLGGNQRTTVRCVSTADNAYEE